VPNAAVAALHIVCHIAAHPWPPKVMGNEFGHFPASRVACYWVIVVSLHNVESELTVTRDVDLSSADTGKIGQFPTLEYI